MQLRSAYLVQKLIEPHTSQLQAKCGVVTEREMPGDHIFRVGPQHSCPFTQGIPPVYPSEDLRKISFMFLAQGMGNFVKHTLSLLYNKNVFQGKECF